MSHIDLPQAEAYQDYILHGVSRTFALTIPQLPNPLRRVVSNAYLLCRIADTIEDDSQLNTKQKQYYAQHFLDVVAKQADATAFAQQLVPLLAPDVLADERDLIAHTPHIITLTHQFSPVQQAAILRCVRIMVHGMTLFQQKTQPLQGLRDIDEMSLYCYYVAGVVGEMLTDLFCDHCTALADQHQYLKPLGVSFGLALQMTNILKDLWEDRQRGACWLPRDVFAAHGVDLVELTPGMANSGFAAGLETLLGVAHTHAVNALQYILTLPKQEVGIRRFCLWSLGMALLTLRKINAHRDFSNGKQVKISRHSVYATVWVSNFNATSNTRLKWLFYLLTRGLPKPQPVNVVIPDLN